MPIDTKILTGIKAKSSEAFLTGGDAGGRLELKMIDAKQEIYFTIAQCILDGIPKKREKQFMISRSQIRICDASCCKLAFFCHFPG